jgi:hypothetical protein
MSSTVVSAVHSSCFHSATKKPQAKWFEPQAQTLFKSFSILENQFFRQWQ